MTSFFELIEIPYIEEALNWKSGGDPSVYSWWDGGFSYKNYLSQRIKTPKEVLY